MKSTLRAFIPLFSLAAALPAFAADAPVRVQEMKTPPDTQKRLRTLSSTRGEMETVTYLGIETGPVSATLSAQLGLNPGSGLVVIHVGASAPASGVLKAHDILLKFDDQILIEQRQLSVLVRGKKEGDEVTLTYLRGGKQETVKVKLGKHEMQKVSAVFTAPMSGFGAAGGFFGQGQNNFAFAVGPDGAADGADLPGDVITNREEVNRVLSLIDAAKGPGQRRISVARIPGQGPGSVSVTVDTGNSQISSSDDQGSLEVTFKDGQKQLVAKNVKGEQIFAGPVNTPEERKALPDEVRERLDKLENMHQFKFSADADFQGAETKLFHIPAQGISLPRQSQPAGGARRSNVLFF
jgi:serine protease Do